MREREGEKERKKGGTRKRERKANIIVGKSEYDSNI